MEKPLFMLFKEFVNENETFSRQDLLQLESNLTTLDVYRRRLEVCGYLEKTGRGEYKRLKEVPEMLNSSALARQCRAISLQNERNT